LNQSGETTAPTSLASRSPGLPFSNLLTELKFALPTLEEAYGAHRQFPAKFFAPRPESIVKQAGKGRKAEE
jgi:hypothetical protein